MRRREDMPTPGQLRVLRLIVGAYRARRPQPTIREIGAELGIKSTNGVSDYLRKLEAKGYIIRARGRARSITPTAAGESWGAA